MNFAEPNNFVDTTLEKYDKRLIELGKGIVGTGVRPSDTPGGRGTLAIFVDKLTPQHRHLHNKKFGSLYSKVIEVGEITLSADHTARTRPLCGGVSISNVGGTAGTLGAIVRDETYQRLYGITCAHVVSSYTKYPGYNIIVYALGDVVIQPGNYDDGTEAVDRIGTVISEKWLWYGGTLNYDESAYILLDDQDDTSPIILDLFDVDSQRTVTSADAGCPVAFSGRTSGAVKTSISYISGTITVTYGSYVCSFSGQIVTPRVSQDGDSGALLVDSNTHEAVGMLFAAGSSVSIFNPINQIIGSDYYLTTVAQKDFIDYYDIDQFDAIDWGVPQASVPSGELAYDWLAYAYDSVWPINLWYNTTRQRSAPFDSATGQMQLPDGDFWVSMVIDLGRTSFSFEYEINRFANGTGTPTLMIRGRLTSFAFSDSETVGPAWEEYTGEVTKSWRYIQLGLQT